MKGVFSKYPRTLLNTLLFTRIFDIFPSCMYWADHPFIDFLFNLRRVQYLDFTSMGPAAAPRFLEAPAEL